MKEVQESHYLLNCKSVALSVYGFVELVPVQAASLPDMKLTLPSAAVLWMLEAEGVQGIGFLSSPRGETQSGLAGP